jgi:hypothetical protein
MFAWVAIRAENSDVLAAAVGRAWSGGEAEVAQLAFAARRAPRQIAVIGAAGARARRTARWPDVLGDWSELNEEPLFPASELCVLAEELSGLGAPALCAHGGDGLATGTVAWYERGALIGYEHVGSTSVSWDPEEGLGRPFDGSAASLAALGGKRVAKLFGADRAADVLERQLLVNRAIGDVLLVRAFHRLLDQDPPPIDDLAGMVATAPKQRVAAT